MQERYLDINQSLDLVYQRHFRISCGKPGYSQVEPIDYRILVVLKQLLLDHQMPVDVFLAC